MEGEIEEGPDRGTRDRIMTDKGRDYMIEIRERERHRVMKRLEVKTRELKDVLLGDHEAEFVRSQYSNWLNDYETLLEVHGAFQALLEPEAVTQDTQFFQNNCSSFLKLKHECVDWLLVHGSEREDDRKSCMSRRSCMSSASSQVSIERFKEEARKAELLARQEALKEKQTLEQEKLRLKQKEEVLEIQTELKVSDAKSKILEDLDQSLAQDKRFVAETLTDKKQVYNRSHIDNISVKNNVTKQSDSDGLNILTVSRELNKPKVEISKFNGSTLDYTRFKRQFNARICQNTDSYDERLNYLLQFTSGEAYKIVVGYSNLPAKSGYEAAFEEFEERYGDSELIAHTYVKKVLDWPSIKADNPKALDEFAIFLRECQYAVEHVQAARVLEYSENLRLIVQKLPYYLHDRWRNVVYDIKSKGKIVSFETLVAFVRKEAKKATDPIYGKEMLNNKQSKPSPSYSNNNTNTRKALATVISNSDDNTPTDRFCLFCNEQHGLQDCNNIIHLSLTDRYAFLKSKGLCFGCLRAGHIKSECKNRSKCAKCKRLHLTVLHVEPRNGELQEMGVNGQNKFYPTANVNTTRTGAGAALPVVAVRVKAKSSNKFLETYAFLDSGSTATFCSDRVFDTLGLEGKMSKINIVTLGHNRTVKAREVSGLEICSLNGDYTLDLPTVFTQPSLPISQADIPSESDLNNWPYLRHIPLERINSEVDLLIGVNVPKVMEPWEVVPSENGGPFAVKTMFGWILNGPLGTSDDGHNIEMTCNYIRTTSSSSISLDEQIKEYFNQDFPERSIDDRLENSREDHLFLDLVKNSTVKRNGHYCIDLPFKHPAVNMPNNRNQASQRLTMLAKRFERDPEFHKAYTEFMNKITEKGYAQKVPMENLTEQGKVWYLPHHGVFHPKKLKIRVVFDCAAKYRGTSLNDQLLQGPNLTNSIIGTLTRFRQERVAIMGDIESMFYQVYVPQRDQNFQRFLWWPDGDTSRKVEEYQMKVHLFGSTSSPSCANFALRRTAEDMRGKVDDEALNTILRNMYVDDCLKSIETESSAISLVREVQNLMKGGGFHISKWTSNSREVMRSIPVEDRAAEVKDLDLDQDQLPIERTLGVSWSAESDVFSFTVDIKEHPHTRRGILSTVSSIYDPLGFLAPMILSAKAMLQELCQLRLGWDDHIPEDYDKRWCRWLEGIRDLRNFEVARCFKPEGFGVVVLSELHHFSDASEKGYGMISYLRLINSEGNVHCSFVFGKSRVAPLKKVTIPRLELTGATVSVRTDKMLKRELDMRIDQTFFWTDSMAVLRYIRNTKSRFQTFVANRLNVIHEGSVPEQWRYVNTKMNPADVASRGMPVNQAEWRKNWIEAPAFLLLPVNEWPITPKEVHAPISDDPEIKVAVVNSTKLSQNIDETDKDCVDQIISYHSSWHKLKKSIAWILKIRDKLLTQASTKEGSIVKIPVKEDSNKITVSDLKRAEDAIITYVQRKAFRREIQDLEKGQSQIRKISCIRSLDPVLDKGILRVGGRLNKSSMPEKRKHPAILPKGHHISTLVLRQIHENLMHAGRNHMLAVLRQQFWIINAPSAIRKLLSKCVVCRRFKAPAGEQKMADLPEDRVTPDDPPFTRVGVDYFGPFEVKVKRSHVKRYGVIFTCLACRAVHLEIAHSLDTNSYINALRRFIARRGQVTKMISDNGTNFVGAERELEQCINEWNLTQIEDSMMQSNVDWQFNPPAGSHFGGVWERLIRSVRSAINSTVREQVLDHERLLTLMCEVEAVLNSRPITKNSDQCNDLEALTPNHLLLQKTKPSLPPGVFEKTDNYCRRRWRQVQYMTNVFWQRWVREYLPLLQERQKWNRCRKNLQLGDIVLIVDSNAPRNSWPMGVITETLPDRSGHVRQVMVKTATNTLKRPIDKLCALLEAD